MRSGFGAGCSLSATSTSTPILRVGLYLSNAGCYVDRMKHNWLNAERDREEVMATFGGAQIIKYLDGKLEIKGGTEGEKAQAHAWMKQFLDNPPFTLKRI